MQAQLKKMIWSFIKQWTWFISSKVERFNFCRLKRKA